MNRAAMLRFLVGVVGPEGAVPSWLNPRHPGFAYPEAAAIVLRLLALEPEPPRGVLDRLTHFLATKPAGKDGRVYTFDRGIVMAALATAGLPVGEEPQRIAHAIAEGIAVQPVAPARWSTVLGPHLLKLAIAAHLVGGAGERALLQALVPLRPLLVDGGRIPTPPRSDTYVHAHCYAAEGLLALGDLDTARRAAVWLAEIQTTAGGLPQTHDGRIASGPHPADATAQAVRLWCCIDRSQFAPAIDRGLAFLDGLVDASGGLRYSDASDDVNTWATAFAIQALDFAHGDASPTRIL
jgi:hypothetical protein